MKKLLSFLRMDKKLQFQFLFVVAAFFTMVLISSIFGSRIVNKNVSSYGEEVVNSSAEVLNAYIYESKLLLNDAAFSLERIKNNGGGTDVMLTEIVEWSKWMLGGQMSFGAYSALYGVADGVYLDGDLWVPPAGYVPQSRPWYTGALQQNGEISYANPYIDANTGEYVLTVSKNLYDKDGNLFGVIAFDVFMSGLYDYISGLSLMNSGYGLFLDLDRNIVIHPDKEFIGMKLEDVNNGKGGYTEMASQLAIGKNVSARSYVNYAGVESVAFFKKLDTGFYVGIVAPKKVYTNDVIEMVTLLSVVGFALMLVLSILLAFLHIEKNRSDEANRSKSSFLANMSHEIRTPMNAIIGMTELLANEPLTNRQQGYVNDINISSHSLLSIINDILDLSKIETGKLELVPVNYDFRTFTANLGSMFKFVAQKKNLDFIYEESGELPYCLFGDDLRLRQVLTNICGNAVKFTEKGFIRLRITEDGDMLLFEIKDTGMGIRKEEIPKLFKPFEQTDVLKNRNTVGTGLGLSISKSFIDMMGGRITVDSTYGEGTTFTVIIPKVIGDENLVVPAGQSEHGKKEQQFFAPDANVLIVDDNEINLKVASGLLNMFKIKSDTAISGKEAISLVRQKDYDIVFMDHMMPGMDGIETTEGIRKLGGKYKRLTIIALTANAIQGAKEMFIASGLDGFISKPIEMDKLKEILRQWLPSDKIEIAAEEAPAAADNSSESAATIADASFIDSLGKVSSVNVQIGLGHVSGIEDMYQETVLLFYKKLLGECDKMEAFLKEKDMRSLAISVHGMKSSLATIGAMELSNEAFGLEKASKSEDGAYCDKGFPVFLGKLRSLYEQIAAVLPKDGASSKSHANGYEHLAENVQNALAAVEDFDLDAGVEALNNALMYDYGNQINELLENAKSALSDFDFDAAKQYLTELTVSCK